MPIELKDGFDVSQYVRAAAERKAADEAFTQYSETQLNNKTESILSFRVDSAPKVPVGVYQVMNSRSWLEYVKQMKMEMGIFASATEGLEQDIVSAATEGFAVLDDLQREVAALDSFVTEEEVKVAGRYSQVHFNSFVRPEDAARPYDDSEWLIDYKTKLPFHPDNMMDVLPGAGLTLPLRHSDEIIVSAVELVGEETDVGDTTLPIISNDPNNLLRKDRVFRHVLIRTDADGTSRKYNYTPSYCTLLFTLAGLQLVNRLSIRPLGSSPVYIESISYLNESAEEITLTSTQIPNDTETTVLFEPVRTKYLKVKFRQYAPVTRTQYTYGDIRIREINKILIGSGYSQTLPGSTELIQGRVFDFSMESISIGLRVYENLGVYRAQALEVRRPVGLLFSDAIEAIQVSNDNRTYGTTNFLSDGEALLERYLGVDLELRSGRSAIRELIPIPDAVSVQREFLPIASGECRVKLFPDLVWNLDYREAVSARYLIGICELVFANPHEIDVPVGVTQTTEVGLLTGTGPDQEKYNFTSTNWKVVDDYTVQAVPSEFTPPFGDILDVDPDRPPRFWIRSEQQDPVSVYRESTPLVIGTDYQVSLNGGSTWFDKWPIDARWNVLKKNAKAGTFKIRFLNPDHSAYYWAEYRILKDQQLSSRPGVSLKNNRVVFSRQLASSSGKITTVIVARSDNPNVYLTPVVLSYFLKVRERVS